MGGTWSPVILFENSVDPASVGDVRHPASGLAQCRLALLTPERYAFEVSNPPNP